MKSPQEIFDTVVRHAWSMPCSSSNQNGLRCLYRGPNGNRCFIGIFLDDDIAHKADSYLMGNSIVGLLGGPLKEHLPDFLHQNGSLLHSLQFIHDEQLNWQDKGKGPALKERMAPLFRNIAKKHGLSTAVLEPESKPLPKVLTDLLSFPQANPVS